MMRHYVRAFVATLILGALVAGVPLALAATVGNPLNGWSDLIAGDLSDYVVIDVLAGVAYLAWAQFALTVLVEVVAVLLRIRILNTLPGVFGSQQRFAHSLVAAVFLIAPVTSPLAAAPTGPALPPPTPHLVSAAQLVAGQPDPGAAASTRGPDAGGDTGRTSTTAYVITKDGPGTYWDLAHTFLGDGRHWQDIWDLNHGRRQPDGQVMDNPGLLVPGWTVLIPDARTDRAAQPQSGGPADRTSTQVTVQAGDTLSGIAASHDVADWHRLWLDNVDRPQPGGARLTNPDHIEPGWLIDLRHRTPSKTRVTSASAAAHPLPPSLTSPVDIPPPHGSPSLATAGTGSRTTGAEPSATRSATATGAPTIPAQPEDDSDGDVIGIPSETLLASAGGLLAGMSALGLLAYRRRQQRHRRPGRAVPPVPTDLARMDRALRGASTRDITWVDDALRGLSAQCAATPDGRLPDVMAACLNTTGLDLVLATAHHHPPGEWTTDTHGTRWHLDRGAETGHDADRAAVLTPPYPALVSVGYTSTGDTWLLDLEHLGQVWITGHLDRCLDLARFMTAELAHNPWPEMLGLTVAGFGAELAGLNPDRLLVMTDAATAARGVHALTTQLATATAARADSGTDVLTARLRDAYADTWFPQLLFMAPAGTVRPTHRPAPAGPAGTTGSVAAEAPAAQNGPPWEPGALDGLFAALRRDPGRTTVAVIRVGGSPNTTPTSASRPWHVQVDDDGNLRIPQLSLELTAHRLTATDARDLARLMRAAADLADVLVPEARGDAPWQALADATGAPRTSLVVSRSSSAPVGASDVPRLIALDDDPSASILPLPTPSYVAAAATTPDDLERLVPTVPTKVRQRAADADPTLDEDLAAWHDPTNATAKLALLGPVIVHASGSLPDERPRLAWHTEVLACLATRPRGAAADELAEALWPNARGLTSVNQKLRLAIHTIRAWLGDNPATGHPHIPAATRSSDGPGTYRVDGILIDADLFQRLRLRGTTHGPDGITDLEAALRLVTGRPFDHQRRDGYTWLADMPLDLEYTAMITDVAHIVATHHLAAGNLDAAADAARTALLAGSPDDTPLLDLVAACDAQGHTAEAAQLVQRILTNHDADIEEDLPPRTADILHRRHWLTRPPGSAAGADS